MRDPLGRVVIDDHSITPCFFLGYRVNPTDLCLEFGEADEQKYIVLPPVTRFSSCVLRFVRSGRDVGFHITQLLKFVFFHVPPIRVTQSPRIFDDS